MTTKEQKAASKYFKQYHYYEDECDAIENAFLAGVEWARENPAWIRMSEAEPPKDSNYYIFKRSKFLFEDIEEISIGTYQEDEEEWFLQNPMLTYDTATHWQRLEPPKPEGA